MEIKDIKDEDFIEVYKSSISREEVLRKLNLYSNGNNNIWVKNTAERLGLSPDILKQNKFNKYHLTKICPVCGKEFITTTTKKGSRKVCCSIACSNTYFRSGKNNGAFKDYEDLTDADRAKLLYTRRQYEIRKQKFKEIKEDYGISRRDHINICFKYQPHKCCVCGEENIVAVHHYDKNHYNNEPSNLIPLCPTHHQYLHSTKFKKLIIDKVEEYRKTIPDMVKKYKEEEPYIKRIDGSKVFESDIVETYYKYRTIYKVVEILNISEHVVRRVLNNNNVLINNCKNDIYVFIGCDRNTGEELLRLNNKQEVREYFNSVEAPSNINKSIKRNCCYHNMKWKKELR